jgi:hypothetical protein
MVDTIYYLDFKDPNFMGRLFPANNSENIMTIAMDDIQKRLKLYNELNKALIETNIETIS